MKNLNSSTAERNLSVPQRISAKLRTEVSWQDKSSGDRFTINGVTENLGATSVLVNLEVLPDVGTDVLVRLFNENEFVVETEAEVIRIVRDPSQPQVALSIVDDQDIWESTALESAETWSLRDLKLNESDDWSN